MTLSALTPLLGVVVGAAGALLGQQLANRAASRREGAARTAAIREVRREMIVAFLEAVQPAERAAQDIHRNGGQPDDTDSRMDHVWFRQKCVEVTCTSPVRSATWRYAERLSDAIYGSIPQDTNVFKYIAERRGPFITEARAELGIAEVLEAEAFNPEDTAK